ncbi:RidA family protein [Pseudomonas sp. MBLB4136]|uniref:RidA family protein n=1 Tax=Pseudomonas sp. MBLB4136 TaxID=3451558 RepID=UPI003F751F47
MSSIQRIDSNAKLSRVVVYQGVAWLSGLVAADCSQDIRGQTRQVLARLDELLASIGSDRSRVLSTQLWMKDMSADFAAMNEEWSAWCAGEPPARATCQVTFDDPDIRLELIVTAAA